MGSGLIVVINILDLKEAELKEPSLTPHHVGLSFCKVPVSKRGLLRFHQLAGENGIALWSPRRCRGVTMKYWELVVVDWFNFFGSEVPEDEDEEEEEKKL